MEKITYKLIKKIFLILFFLVLFPNISIAANLFVSPSSGNYNLGDRVVFRVMASSESAFNAVSGSVQFSTSQFVIESISKSGSILNFWVSEPTFFKETGMVYFEGVVLGGFSGKTGEILTVTARTKSEGLGKIEFLTGKILANDGQGTNITKGLSGSLINVIKIEPISQEIKLDTVSDEDKIKEEVNKPKEEIVDIVLIDSPHIKYMEKYGNPIISGQSNYPLKHVLVTFISENGSKIFITEKTDINGGFEINIPDSLRFGTYSVTAIVIIDSQNNSQPSNELKVVAGDVIKDVDWRIWISFVLFSFALIFILYKYFSKKISNFFPKLKKEVGDVNRVVDKSFFILDNDIKEIIKNNKGNSKNKESIEQLENDLKGAKGVIKDELNDIRSL